MKITVVRRMSGGIRRFVYSLLIVCIIIWSTIHVAFNLYLYYSNNSRHLQYHRLRILLNFLDHFKSVVFNFNALPFSVINVVVLDSNQTRETFPRNNETIVGRDFYYLPTLYQSDYTFLMEGEKCLKEGTDVNGGIKLNRTSLELCPCKEGWHGTFCSVPAVVFHSVTPWNKNNLTLRRNPRRIIQALPFNIEFEMLEIRFAELYDVIDVFLILESNYTCYGNPKEQYLLNRIKNGSYSEYASKIVYVFLDFFPEGARKDGWIAQVIHRNYIGTHGLKKIRNWTNDDLFFLSDADEIPSRKALLFLKLHDGYTEPISYVAWWTVYGFFWTPSNKVVGIGQPGVQNLFSCVTMGMVVNVFRRMVDKIRTPKKFIAQHELDVNIYIKMGGKIDSWAIGTESLAGGWHCSWCVDAEGIRYKLLSAQNGDFPRWGDYPEKTNVTYIRSLVRRGLWFDDKSRMTPVNLSSSFVPQHVWFNRDRYRHMISNPY